LERLGAAAEGQAAQATAEQARLDELEKVRSSQAENIQRLETECSQKVENISQLQAEVDRLQAVAEAETASKKEVEKLREDDLGSTISLQG